MKNEFGVDENYEAFIADVRPDFSKLKPKPILAKLYSPPLELSGVDEFLVLPDETLEEE